MYDLCDKDATSVPRQMGGASKSSGTQKGDLVPQNGSITRICASAPPRRLLIEAACAVVITVQERVVVREVRLRLHLSPSDQLPHTRMTRVHRFLTRSIWLSNELANHCSTISSMITCESRAPENKVAYIDLELPVRAGADRRSPCHRHGNKKNSCARAPD